jgi:hypothetical protein
MQVRPANAYRLLTTPSLTSAPETATALTPMSLQPTRPILGIAAGCVASSVYGFLAGAWPFGVVELIWAGVALRRYRDAAAV